MERIKVSQLRPATTENYGMRNVNRINSMSSSEYMTRVPSIHRPQVSKGVSVII